MEVEEEEEMEVEKELCGIWASFECTFCPFDSENDRSICMLKREGVCGLGSTFCPNGCKVDISRSRCKMCVLSKVIAFIALQNF